MIEMTIPSSLDPTLTPEGHHVVLLFTQFTPYTLADGRTWSDEERNKYADTGRYYIMQNVLRCLTDLKLFLGCCIFRHGTCIFRHGTYIFRHGALIFRHGTRIFRHGTCILRHGTCIFKHT